MRATGLVLLLAAACAWRQAAALDFEVHDHFHEQDARDNFLIAVGSSTAQVTKEVGQSILKQSMNRAWWGLTADVVDSFRQHKVDLASKVFQQAAAMKRQLTVLTDTVASRKRGTHGIPPAVQWAQSPSEVYMNIKFSAKWDTPATLGCELDQVKFSDGNFVLFSSKCPRSGKKFELKLQLFGDVLEEGSSWRLESVGRAVLTLKKASSAVWPRLLKSKAKPGNIHVWWSLKEKYERENSHFSAQNKKPTEKPDAGAEDAAAPPAAEPSTAPEAASTTAPTPTPDPQAVAAAALSRKHSAEMSGISASRRAKVTKLEAAAKERKAAIDAAADADKAAVDKQLEAERAAVDAETKAEREAAQARHTQERLAQQADSGKTEL